MTFDIYVFLETQKLSSYIILPYSIFPLSLQFRKNDVIKYTYIFPPNEGPKGKRTPCLFELSSPLHAMKYKFFRDPMMFPLDD